jgi:hypothetical protein
MPCATETFTTADPGRVDGAALGQFPLIELCYFEFRQYFRRDILAQELSIYSALRYLTADAGNKKGRA